MRVLALALLAFGLVGPAGLYAQSRDEERIVEEYEKVLELLKVADDGEQPDEDEARARAGIFDVRLKAFLERWLAQRSGLKAGRFTLGRALALGGRPAEAAVEFRAYLRLVPAGDDRDEANVALGTSLLDAGRPLDAVAALEAFLAQAPDSLKAGAARYYLALALHRVDGSERSLALLAQVAQSERENPLGADAEIKRIEILRDLGRATQALAALEPLRTENEESAYLESLREQLVQFGTAAPEWGPLVATSGPGKLPKRETLKSLRGRVVVLNIFAKHYDACAVELGHLKALKQRLADDVVFVGLTKPYRRTTGAGGVPVPQQVEEVERWFRGERDLPFELVVSPNFDVFRAYGVRGLPHTVVIGRDGRIVFTKTGASRTRERPLRWVESAIRRAL